MLQNVGSGTSSAEPPCWSRTMTPSPKSNPLPVSAAPAPAASSFLSASSFLRRLEALTDALVQTHIASSPFGRLRLSTFLQSLRRHRQIVQKMSPASGRGAGCSGGGGGGLRGLRLRAGRFEAATPSVPLLRLRCALVPKSTAAARARVRAVADGSPGPASPARQEL